MRARILIPLAAAATLAAPASASAFFAHTVTPGESLSSIAAADGLSVAQVAAANGLPLNASLIALAARAGTTAAALAAANGLDPNGILLAGRAIHVPSGSTALPVSTTLGGTAETQPVGTPAQGNPTSPPYPTPERLSASQIG